MNLITSHYLLSTDLQLVKCDVFLGLDPMSHEPALSKINVIGKILLRTASEGRFLSVCIIVI